MISLQKLCLDRIAEEFEKFHLAFMNSNEGTLKRLFDFLPRKYSFEILSELSSKRILAEEYMNYLMNEHLKCLHCNWLIGTRYENAMGDILCRVPNLTKLYCFQYICSDEILEHIAKFCPKIAEIHADDVITDEGIKYLCKNESGKLSCPELNRLIMDLDGVTDESLKRLIQDLPSLEIICPSKILWILYLIHKKDLPGFANVQNYNLVELVVQNSRELKSYYSDLLKICLTVCPRLKVLTCSISDKGQLNFFENTRLKELTIDFLETESKVNVNNFLKNCGSDLTFLEIWGSIMSTSILTVSCPKLEHFTPIDVTFIENDAEAVFQSLASFHFYGINTSSLNKAVHLLSSPKLQKIEFRFCSLSPGVKTFLLRCCENYDLQDISFHYTRVEMNFLKDILLCCSSLKILDLRSLNDPDDEIKKLTEFAATLPNKPCIGFVGKIFDGI